MHKVEINPPFIKLDQLLKFSGLAESGGHAKEIIAEGAVLVNGEACAMRGKKIKPGDHVQVDETVIEVVARECE